MFVLIGLFGSLAFIFSAVSPEDDDFQQEFVQGTKTRQCLVRNIQSISIVNVVNNKSVRHAAILCSLSFLKHTFTSCVLHLAVSGVATILSTPIVGRSPPS